MLTAEIESGIIVAGCNLQLPAILGVRAGAYGDGWARVTAEARGDEAMRR